MILLIIPQLLFRTLKIKNPFKVKNIDDGNQTQPCLVLLFHFEYKRACRVANYTQNSSFSGNCIIDSYYFFEKNPHFELNLDCQFPRNFRRQYQ